MEATPKKSHKGIDWVLIGTVGLIVFVYICIHDLAGGSLLNHDPHDSYTLQALSWLRGSIPLLEGANYPWLELAIYNGQYYVSFPPLPAVFMLVPVLFFGVNTPNNIIVIVYTIAAFVGAYHCFKACGVKPWHCVFWAVLAIYGSSMFEISTNGGVWLQAQTLNMLLCMWGVYFAIKNKRMLCLTFFALAVGCRPFSALYLPMAVYYFFRLDNKQHTDIKTAVWRSLKKQWPAILTACVIVGTYMAYNFYRFGSFLEFGHNYLPEFTQAEHGQFYLGYVPQNLFNIFLRPLWFDAKGGLEFPLYAGFMFYVVNTLFLIYFITLFKDVWKKRITDVQIVITICLVLNLFLLCCHKSFGGYQFGARYTLDFLPFAMFYLILAGKSKPTTFEQFVCGFAVIFNAYGAMYMRLLQSW